jgi:hypothetical protein
MVIASMLTIILDIPDSRQMFVFVVDQNNLGIGAAWRQLSSDK